MTISMKQRKHNQYAWYASAGVSHNYFRHNHKRIQVDKQEKGQTGRLYKFLRDTF